MALQRARERIAVGMYVVSLCFPKKECCAEASMVFAKVTIPGVASVLVSAVLVLGGILLV